MQRTPATTVLEARVAQLVEESSLGTPGARQLRERGRLAAADAGLGWEKEDLHDLLAMSDTLPSGAEH